MTSTNRKLQAVDNILRHGNDLYNMHIATFFSDKPRYLLASELPETVRIINTQFVARQSSILTGLISTRQSEADSLTFQLLMVYTDVLNRRHTV